MSTKKDPQQWEHALKSLQKSNMKTIPSMENSMFPRLKLSYDSLRDDMTRECFLCCSLWPEDHVIDYKKLIECWMGLGLIEYKNICDAYNLGHFLIGDLKEACLLEPGIQEDMVKMHDVIRDLALWIASECGAKVHRWIVKAGVGADKALEDAAKWREAEKVSLMRSHIEALPQQLVDCPSLCLLMLQVNFGLQVIPPGFFQHMPSLTYLDLSNTHLQELPAEVGCLVELKYLNLSGTHIKSLPKELGRLTKLRYLFLINTFDLEIILDWVLLDMPWLWLVDAFPCGSFNPEALENLTTIRGMCVQSSKTLWKLQLLSATKLCIKIVEDLSILQLQMFDREMAPCLEELWIDCCESLVEMVTEGPCLLPRLEQLILCNLRQLRKVAPAQCLPSLKLLEISKCPNLKDVTWVLQLPCLVELTIEKCSGMEQVIGGEAAELLKEQQALPSLQCVYLRDVPKLVSICAVPLPFPSLEYVCVSECPELRCLPFRMDMAHSSKSLKIKGSRSWWEALNWEDDIIKSSFQPLFEVDELLSDYDDEDQE